MTNEQPYRIKSITEYHKLRGFPKPEHPLISFVNIEEAKYLSNANLVLDFYSISNKRGLHGKLKYGQQEYNFNDGVMFFLAPSQVFKVEHSIDEPPDQPIGWMLLILLIFYGTLLWQKTLNSMSFLVIL